MRREDVDSFTHNETSWIPYSQFKAKFNGDISSVTDLECDVDVIGAKYPHNNFGIDISPEGTYAFIICSKSILSSVATNLCVRFIYANRAPVT